MNHRERLAQAIATYRAKHPIILPDKEEREFTLPVSTYTEVEPVDLSQYDQPLAIMRHPRWKWFGNAPQERQDRP